MQHQQFPLLTLPAKQSFSARTMFVLLAKQQPFHLNDVKNTLA
jgi:hypothetical protein